MDKSTKYCEITVYLKTGIRIAGNMHVPLRTSSAFRPSDAIRESEGFLLLSDATIRDSQSARQQEAMLVRVDAISHIDLPEKGWTAREVAEAVPTSGFMQRQVAGQST